MSETKIDERGASGAQPRWVAPRVPWVVATKNPAGVHSWLGQDGVWTSSYSFDRVRVFENLADAHREAVRVNGFEQTLAQARTIKEHQ